MHAGGLAPGWLMDVIESIVAWAAPAYPPSRRDCPVDDAPDPESYPASPRDPLDITIFI